MAAQTREGTESVDILIRDILDRHNRISADQASVESCAGMRIFDTPLAGCADAQDPIFREFRDNPEILYGRFVPPRQWLDGACSVISIFFPYTKRIKDSNTLEWRWPSPEWLHGRYEGQQIINACTAELVQALEGRGFRALAPSLDPRLVISESGRDNGSFYSSWSERHVAHAAGLGTFGLSRGLITPRGMAGRFSSIISDMPLSPTERSYKSFNEYCLRCGACIGRCPVRAISHEEGKRHGPCSRFLDVVGRRFSPRYGCGKCQTGTPCADGIPLRTDGFGGQKDDQKGREEYGQS